MRWLKEGDVLALRGLMRQPHEYAGKRCYWVTDSASAYGNWDRIPAGEFLVVRVGQEGGGTGMGRHDTFPDGHHVWAQKLKDGVPHGPLYMFYQHANSFINNVERDLLPMRQLIKSVSWLTYEKGSNVRQFDPTEQDEHAP